MEVRVSSASAVVVQRVPAAGAEWFLEWQRGITAAAEGFAGYRGTDVYPPADSQRDEWVVVIHFDDEKSLQQWLGSPVRAQWVEQLRARVGDFELQALPGGFGPWFASLPRRPATVPPPWKMALTVLLAGSASAAISLVQHVGTAADTVSGTALSVTVPAGGVAGDDTLVVTFAMDPATGTVT